MSYELILDFDYYSSRRSLLSSLPETIQSSVVLLSSPDSIISNFIIVSIEESLSFEGIPHLRKVYPQRKLEHKSLTFFSESNGNKVTELIEAEKLWNLGFTGKGVKIGILDSGFSSKDQDSINVVECINFTNDTDCDDKTGHGTFMASLISSTHAECPGIAPDAQVYSLKVFSSYQESYTSWFLNAFNYAIENNITILSLSTGGIDFMDEVFVNKITELTNLGIVIVSAAGNDGPGFGSLSNPGDQPEIIGVGGLDETGLHVADFSSRGPTLWEIYGGMGRFKPDIVTYSVNIKGYYMGRCGSNSGTSVSTPIIAASIALLWQNSFTPSLIKQALILTAIKLPEYSIYEQGAGKLNLLKAKEYLDTPIPKLIAFPQSFNNYDDYFYPYSLQELYTQSPPMILNITLIHSSQVSGELSLVNSTKNSKLNVNIEFTKINAYTASLGLFITALESSILETIEIIIESGDLILIIPISLRLKKNSDRNNRILWDLGHNLKFPEAGPVMRDELEGSYLFDWRGDHPFTNLLSVYRTAIEMGYIVDFLYDDFSCVDGNLYSIYLIIDPEKSYSDYEISKIQYDMEKLNVSLIIFGEWSDTKTLEMQLAYSNFTSAIPGCNIQTINKLLSPYFIELGISKSFTDTGRIGSQKFSYQQGAELTRMPAGGYLITQVFQDPKLNKYRDVGVLGMTTIGDFRIGVFGDSSCLDAVSTNNNCLWILRILLEFGSIGQMELDKYFMLPYDYDIHIEETTIEDTYKINSLSTERTINLQCLKKISYEIIQFEPSTHELSDTKIRAWAPLREFEPFDIVGIVQFLTLMIVIILFGILFFTRYKARNPARLRAIV